MLLRGLFGGAGVVVMMGFASAPWQLLGLRVLEGMLTGTVAAATALIATSAPKRRLGYALGMVQTAVFAGAAAPSSAGMPTTASARVPPLWLPARCSSAAASPCFCAASDSLA